MWDPSDSLPPFNTTTAGPGTRVSPCHCHKMKPPAPPAPPPSAPSTAKAKPSSSRSARQHHVTASPEAAVDPKGRKYYSTEEDIRLVL
ncbi:hypothetical protein OsI_35727 [Oryza sativa Indica Group]|uniref:Uncharacterized protein n=1 Tax=Oryza sativa subsp. indica TaxID=39946 RepID=B8BJY6_ORYSI|nr:hypothetical protein OsI_35727 [Oryza sativa Indica Group]